MSFYLLLTMIAASPFLTIAFPQNSDNAPMEIALVDGFVFDGLIASEPSNEQSTSTSITTTLVSTILPSNEQSTSTSITTTLVSTILPNEFNNCIMACPVTNEYNPVCGTDNVIYTNPGGLGCAQRCGKDVTLNHYGRCSTG